MHKIHSTCFIFIIAFQCFSECDNVIPKPIVGIEMSESGFHRDLVYTVQFDYPLAGKDCEYMMQQNLPAGVYISVDQLNDLKRLNKLSAIYPAFVDIEKSTEHSEPFTVLMNGVPKITDSLKLPIHFRYHAPDDQKHFVEVKIDAPVMYIKCLDNQHNVLAKYLDTSANTRYCLIENKPKFIEFNENDDNNDFEFDIENCDWILIDSIIQMKSSLIAKIPIGNKEAFPPILYVTIILSWAISIWTVFRTNTVPRRINQKLEEQRILQNKNK